MNSSKWKAFLQEYGQEIIACPEVWVRTREELSEEIVASRWMGFPPATPLQVSDAEERLKTELPPSLRSFYLLTNGWRTTGFFIWEILPVERIGWLRDLIPGLYHIALGAEQTAGSFKEDPGDKRLIEFRLEQGTRVMRSLVISLKGDACNWLLDPGTINSEGEWAAGCWAAWGEAMNWQAESFAELMRKEFESFRELREESA